jgi:putative PIN family toxin of toxin-antitoxin system
MKVVLDTNVLIDGLKDEYSYQKRIINEVISGQIESYANRQTLQENRLITRQLVDNPEYEKQLNDFFAQVNWVYNPRNIHVVRDAEDNKILASAVEAGADYLITSDNDLLEIGSYQQVKIVNPTEFWARYKDEEGDDLWKKWSNFLTGN